MQQTEWEALNVREIPCPKCGIVGKLVKLGRDRHKKYYRVDCNNCQASSSERLLSIPEGKQPAPVTPNPARSSNNTLERLTRLEDMLEKFLQGQGVEIKPAEVKTETKKATFNWDDYSEERAVKIHQLIGILREHPKWGNTLLERELRKCNTPLHRSVISKVKNAFKEGFFNED